MSQGREGGLSRAFWREWEEKERKKRLEKQKMPKQGHHVSQLVRKKGRKFKLWNEKKSFGNEKDYWHLGTIRAVSRE